MLNFSLDLRLGMLMSVMLIKKTCKPLCVIILLILDINSKTSEEHRYPQIFLEIDFKFCFRTENKYR